MLFFVVFAAAFCASSFRPASNAIRDISPVELVSEIKIGWNIGNTLDARSTRPNPSPTQQETAWGNPLITPELIAAVKAGGFNCIRIPITWGMQTGGAPNYNIRPQWMSRVHQVVDYVLSQGLYCIINTHHETDWFIPSKENEAMLMERTARMWTQIANQFRDYDEHLIFEAFNEPRTAGSELEWQGGTMPEKEVLNNLLQNFVNIVRASGGNNVLRHLMVTPYGAGMYDSLDGFEIPRDPANKLIVSVHNYFPYPFALQVDGRSEWPVGTDEADMAWMAKTLYDKFVSQGIPVIMGEEGAMNKENLEDRVRWVKCIVSELKKNGVPMIWWDNGVVEGDGELFGIINRRTYEWEFPELVEAMVAAAE